LHLKRKLSFLALYPLFALILLATRQRHLLSSLNYLLRHLPASPAPAPRRRPRLEALPVLRVHR
jgi:hypothetical protein